MASPQSILTANSCAPCSGTSLADVLEINILQSILTAQGASMTNDAIMAAVPCYTCLGLSLAESIKLVLLNAVSVAAGGGGGGGTTNMSGAGSPIGVVTPTAINVWYRDTVGDAYYWATGLTNADWSQVV